MKLVLVFSQRLEVSANTLSRLCQNLPHTISQPVIEKKSRLANGAY